MDRLLLVCLAGAIGSGTRYVVVTWTQRFPWGVLGVNVAGSFLIALVMVLAVTKAELTETMRVTLTAGFLGGLTTYSSFNQDTLAMLDKKLYGTAVAYVAATLTTCMLAGLLGTIVGRRL
jgi:fluoride exporter